MEGDGKQRKLNERSGAVLGNVKYMGFFSACTKRYRHIKDGTGAGGTTAFNSHLLFSEAEFLTVD